MAPVPEQKRKFRSKITYSSRASDLNQGRKSFKETPGLILDIPQEILIHWHGLRMKGHGLYANFLQNQAELPFTVVESASLEKRINDIACIALRECRGKSGRKKQELLKKTRSVSVSKVCIPVTEQEDIGDARVECVEHDTAEMCELEKKCFELISECIEAQEKEKVAEFKLKHAESEKSVLQEQNASLAKSVQFLEDFNVCSSCAPSLENNSRSLHDVGPRQRQRKVKELACKAERALWFLNSYGVTLQKLSVVDANGQSTDLTINPGGNGGKVSKYSALPEKEKTKIKEVLHILDKFCVGDAAYHVLTVLESSMPRSYMIKQCRGIMNSTFVITRTPGDLVGAQMSFKAELRRKIKEKVGFMTMTKL